MKSLIAVLMLATCTIAPVHEAFAAGAAQKLGVCLTDSLNVRERKHRAKWIFFSIAHHLEFSQYFNGSEADVDDTDQQSATIISRLLIEDCAQALRDATAEDTGAVAKAFEWVGRVAMQELMADKSVNKALLNYTQYLDKERLSQVLRQK